MTATINAPCPICGDHNITKSRTPDPHNPNETKPTWTCTNPDCNWTLQ